MTRAFFAHGPDCGDLIPDPGGRLIRCSLSPLVPPVSLRRMTVEGVTVLVERWPSSTVPHPAALDRAERWCREAIAFAGRAG